MSTINCVCIIDDDNIYAYGVKKIIRKNDLSDSILIFENGQEALTALKEMLEAGKKLPNLILLDIDMPLMNGWEFLSEFEPLRKKAINDIEIYVISSNIPGSLGEFYKIEKVEKNITDFIAKPIKSKDLQKIMA